VQNPFRGKLCQTRQDHEGDSFDILLDQRVDGLFEVLVESGFAVLHDDGDLELLDLVVVDANHLSEKLAATFSCWMLSSVRISLIKFSLFFALARIFFIA